jgi:hypothetical protein
MYLIPLGQPESVELVIHALRAAGGEADCTSCPVRRVCTKQCLTIAAAVAQIDCCGHPALRRRVVHPRSAGTATGLPQAGTQGAQVAGFAGAFPVVYSVDRTRQKV